MRRKLLAGGAILALLVVLYAAAGYWLVPGYLREALAEAARARGLVFEMTNVDTKPFALRVELGEVALRGPELKTFAKAEAISVDLAWASLWRRGWIVEEVRVLSPDVALGRLPQIETGNGNGGGEPPAVTIRSLVVEDGTLRQGDRVLEMLSLNARDLSTLEGAAGTYEAAARLADGAGQLAARGNVALAPFAAEGTLTVAALRAAQLLPQAKGQLEGEAKYTYRAGEFAFHDVSIAGNGLAYAGIELPKATLRAQTVPIPAREPFEAAAQASVAPHGRIAAQGRVGFSPLELHVNLSAENLPLPQAQRWLPQGVALDIESGSVSGTGLLDVADGVSYQGSVAIGELRLEERGSDTLLLAWKEGETGSFRFASSPLTLEAGEIVVRAPEGRLVIGERGAINVGAVVPAAEGGAAAEGDGFHARFERLRIEQGTLHFADRSLATPFEATIGGLSGTIVGFDTERNDPARVRLNGRVQPYGVARIRGTINLNAPTTLADITANFRNLRLEAFNPYVAKFAGYRIESGRLSAELNYQVREGRLVGSNKLAFQNMQLGEKLEQKGIVDLPLELAVALLSDSRGRIDLAVPVRGNLNDPQFDIGAIVARALGNAVKKIVTAPFRALAALFGGDDDGEEHPGEIAFAAGSAALSPPAEENVARIAEALGKRPQLGVEVRGAYDPERDRQALRARAAREALASAAGVEPPLDMGNPKVRQAAEKLYLSRGGGRPLPEGKALLERIAALTPLDESAARDLARERAETVRAALLEHGVDPARVGLGKASGEAQVAATLALKPVDEVSGAAAGATAPVEDPVRAAQAQLNAAGFDAGPVDGILGPRTKRALIKYQAANGLEVSAELDRATRERLLR